MKNPFTLPSGALLAQTAQGLLFGMGIAYPLLLSLQLPAAFSLCALCCVLAAGGYVLLGCVKKAQGLFYPLVALAMGAVLFKHFGQPLSNAVTLLLSGQPLALAAYARPATILLSLFATALGLALARSESSFFPTVMVACAVLFAVSFSGAQVSGAAFLPMVGAILLCARAKGVSLLRLAPSAALVLLLTLCLLPKANTTAPLLRDFAAQVRQAIDDYFFFNDARTAFSLSTTGYQPLGSEQLGGAVAPADTPVMQVKTSGKTLLRGAIKNEYTGLAWRDATTQRRYLYVNPRFSALKEDLFDLSRPSGALRDALPELETISVTLRADASSTLYFTQRFRSPRGDGIVAYFSPSSEVFATHSLTAGESYTFSGMRLTSETPGVRSLVLSAADARDDYAQTARAENLALPASVGEEVYALANQICARLDNDFDRAAAICLHLQNTYPYTLLQNTPPATRDYVTWFLFEEKQGYCTAFASAMAVMCRAAGIPARYIEGYVATPDSDGVARVTQQHAHAWVEVYFPGFGWLPFDPTPGIGQSPDASGAQGDAPNANPDAPTPSPEGTSAPSPTPSASPSPTPTATPLPTPTPEHNDPAVTPTPEITPTIPPESTPAPTPKPTPEPDAPDADAPWGVLLALLLLALLALIVWRLITASPAHAAARVRMANDALLIWYAAIEEALFALGIRAAAGEPPATFLARAQETLGDAPDLLELGRAVCAARYSRHKISRAQVDQARSVYRALLERMSPAQVICLYARRLLPRR